ncbi:porphobilinogen deaminase-like isoform X1 [Artemia franciscana]|uniref:porphobilinogen deaminase-like isoform X1 n=1 Tax=Artemia franciscana TaxID=6661 RepID=UPI0032D9CBA0
MDPSSSVKVGTRKSQLAMTQTEFVVGLLQKQELSVAFKIVPMSTVGDHILDQPLSQIGEKSLFTKELEVALEKKEVDFVVHSSKDLPTTLPDGMVIAAILEREDPRDSVIVSSRHSFKSISELPPASVVGTSSLRRSAQLIQKYPHIIIKDVRGNLNTRLKKLDAPEGPYDALVLAAAGVKRMGWQNRITQVLDPSVCMYAIGQGALAIECREGDKETIELLSHLYHAETALRCVAERSFLRTLEGPPLDEKGRLAIREPPVGACDASLRSPTEQVCFEQIIARSGLRLSQLGTGGSEIDPLSEISDLNDSLPSPGNYAVHPNLYLPAHKGVQSETDVEMTYADDSDDDDAPSLLCVSIPSQIRLPDERLSLSTSYAARQSISDISNVCDLVEMDCEEAGEIPVSVMQTAL